MRIVILTNKAEAKVDDGDYEKVISQGKWYEDTQGHGTRTYAVKRIKGKKVYMHRFILDFPNCDIDHDDKDGLNNQRYNLLQTSRTQNNLNARIRDDNKSGVKGVYFDNTFCRWKAEIKIGGKKKMLGSFTILSQAAERRKLAEERLAKGYPLTEL